ncbi:short-chain dehydrogenase [Halorientalis sp. IM1011]|uniref:SDR family NAD(P)-dependent oxidoreductase n=1 Tax=Halorientalis sp. IM1011 TaxID=1932360 RepID=UPI00097CCD1F|nr:SDR family NAD(P)-dependent oxidoreductase [Halorientalis sp. IM1011]AQL41607.1 short-chain dehydrogenase [Halorientalis sp. IM1011]
MTDTGPLDGTVCIVTGGGRGLGEATAKHLASEGATVVVNDLGTSLGGEGESSEPADETVAAIRDAGGTAMAHFGDVTDLDYTEELIADAVAEYGHVDAAVNFAGVLRDAYLTEMTGEDWDTVIDVHLRGHFALLRNLARHWDETSKDADRERAFVGVTSPSALGNAGQANYSAAKAGVLGLIRTASAELPRYEARANVLMPVAYTRMIEDIPEEKRPFGEDDMPPEKVAPVVGYLISEAAEGVNGKTVRAQGDMVSLVADPRDENSMVDPEGWTVEKLGERFDELLD